VRRNKKQAFLIAQNQRRRITVALPSRIGMLMPVSITFSAHPGRCRDSYAGMRWGLILPSQNMPPSTTIPVPVVFQM